MVRMHAWAAVAAMLALPAAASSPVMAQVMAPFEIDAAPSARLDKAVDLGGSYAAIPPDEILPPGAIKDSLRAAGFAPVGTPRLQGRQYRVGAISADGEEGRVMVDGRSGKILRFIPASADYGLLQRPVPRFREAGPIPRPPRSIPQLASRTAAPLPLERPVAAPAAPPPAPAARAADPVVAAKPAPTPPPAPEAKPAPTIAPTEPMPPVQGLD